MTDLVLHVRFTTSGDGWITAQVDEVPGAISQGRTRDEARDNVLDALRELGLAAAELNAGDVETLAVVSA